MDLLLPSRILFFANESQNINRLIGSRCFVIYICTLLSNDNLFYSVSALVLMMRLMCIGKKSRSYN